MKVFLRVVATLFVTVSLFLSSAQVQAQDDRLSVIEYRIDRIGGGDGTGCGSAVEGQNHFVMIDDEKMIDPVLFASLPQHLRDLVPNGKEIEVMDSGLAGPWYRTGVVMPAWKLGTPGTVAMHRIQMVAHCSHLYVSETESAVSGGQVVNAIAFLLTLRDGNGQVLFKDNGPAFGVKLPVNGHAITGTRKVYRTYNGAVNRRNRMDVAMPYRYNDPNHKFFFNWVDYEETRVLPGWELSQVDTDAYGPDVGTFLVPADARGFWINNNNPADRVYNSEEQQVYGSFISHFDLPSREVRHIWTRLGQRRIEFDQSRNMAYAPAAGFATLQAKMPSSTTLVPVVNLVATDPWVRIATVPFERNGKVVHAGSGWAMGKLWVYDPKTNSSDFGFFGPELPVEEGNLQLLVTQDNNKLFRMVGRNSFTTSRLYTYDLLSGAKVGQPYDLPFATGQGSESAAYRPELAFSPEDNKLYIVAPEAGRLYWLDLTSRLHGEILIPQGNGIAYKATDVEVDSAKRMVYVSVSGDNGQALVNGKVLGFPFGSSVVTRSVQVGKGPWQMALAAIDDKNTIFVTNAADDTAPVSQGSPDTVSQVDTNSFTEVLPRFPTLNQPTGIVVELK